jgi:hypothetical protein
MAVLIGRLTAISRLTGERHIYVASPVVADAVELEPDAVGEGYVRFGLRMRSAQCYLLLSGLPRVTAPPRVKDAARHCPSSDWGAGRV